MVTRKNNRRKKLDRKENRKVRNATKVSAHGITFKSKLERMVYDTLVEEGLNPKYEPITYTVWKGFRPTVPSYERSTKTKKLELAVKKLIDIRYTPDFILEYDGVTAIIEAKGKENELFPMRKKLFLGLLEKMPNTIYFVVRTKKETLEAIEIIKQYANENN